jgi:hypothetical protein
MFRCDTCQEQLLDRLYGLLDPADADALDAHLADCADCAAAREQVMRWQGLLARAAKSDFPGVTFAPPPEPVAPAAASEPPSPPRRTARDVWVRWAVAASLLLTCAALGGPAARDLIGYARYKPRVDRDVAALEQAKAEQDRLAGELRDMEAKLVERAADARERHDALVTRWLTAEQEALAAEHARPFDLQVMGAAFATPGAPNEYTVTATDRKTRRPKPVRVEAQVKRGDGKILFTQTFNTATQRALKLPLTLWADVTPGQDVALRITATDPQSGTRGTLTETLRLLEPVYITYLTTDRPLYRPGETIYFRSLTLDRARFQPPDHARNLRFTLLGPNRQPLPGLELTGLDQPAAPKPGTRTLEPLRGPDGQPVRGIGTGAFTLPASAASGEYTLTVAELPPNGGRPKPLVERKVFVHKYTPDRVRKTLEFDAKSYGPGDPVRAALQLRDQAKPLAGARVSASVRVQFPNGVMQGYPATVTPMRSDANGRAAISLNLPKAEELREATLTVVVTTATGITETLTRQVPLATRRLGVEFFPEGGDLVAGVPNRVYFRATTSHGQPADIAGTITDGTRTVTAIKTLTDAEHPGVNQGLGVFTLTPDASRRYVLKLDRPLGIIPPTATPFAAALGVAAAHPLTGYALPAAKASGVVLNILDGVTKPGEKLRVKLWGVGAKRTVRVGAYTRGQPVAHQRATLEPGRPTELALDLGAVKFGGVTRVTVFEEADDAASRVELEPVAERLVYRRPGEALKLNFTAKPADGSALVNGAFTPGERVNLTVRATDENDRPTPAIVMAAVVNENGRAMAQDRTGQLLPTYFLLSGEVRHGDDLEHADFLLTDQPQAAAALDLLLGTQGWRRFAEQAPRLFRARVPAEEANRLLMAMDVRGGPMPSSWRGEVRRVFDEYWPKYEAAVTDLDQAEAARQSGEATKDMERELFQARGRYSAQLTELGRAIADWDLFAKSLEARRMWLPVTLFVAFGVGALLVVLSVRRGPSPARRTLRRGAIGFFALGLFVLAAVVVTSRGSDRWKAWDALVPKPDWRGWGGAVAVKPVPVTPPAPNGGVAGGQPGAEPNGVGAEMMRPAPGVGAAAQKRVRPGAKMMMATPRAVHAMVAPRKTGVDRFGRLRERLAAGEVVDRPPSAAPPAGAPFRYPPAPVQRLSIDLRQARDVIAGKTPNPQTVDQALAAILQNVPRAQPLVVRQYAHSRPGAQPDFTETLLWNPVLVLPGDGQAALTFDLSDAEDAYQVLVAGHTLDGRIGGTAGTIEVRKPKSAAR